MRREHLPYRYMSQFKAFFADYEYYLTLSDKPVSVCLTERQMYILSVWNSYTPWITRWYNTEDTSPQELAVIAAEIENLLMCGCGVPVPSVTDRINTQVYNTEVSTTYITNQTTYESDDDTLVTIAPNMTYATGEPADINRMLCLGLEMLLETILSQAAQTQAMTDEENQDLVRQLGAAMSGLAGAGGLALSLNVGAGVVAAIGGPWALLGLALGGIAVGIASLFVGTPIDALTDEDAIEAVRCTLAQNAMGVEPSFSMFNGLLSPNEFESGSNAEKLAAIVQPFLDNLTVYIQFMMAMSDLYATTLLAALPECEVCPPPPPDPSCVDLTVTPEIWGASLGRSQWIDGTGWTTITTVDGTFFRVARAPEAVSVNIQEVRLMFNIPVTNMRVSIAGVNCDFAGPSLELVMNESNFPALFPFSSGAPNSITVMKNVALNFSDQPTMAMIQSCVIPVP